MIKIINMLLCCFALSSCSYVISEHQDWEFMKQVGGLSVAGQDKNPNWLIVRGDVSGLKEFSHKPTLVNSALTVKSVESIIDEKTIKIYVVTTLTSEKYPSPEIYGVNISGAKKGQNYIVQYLNPDQTVVDLKEVAIH